MQDWLRKCEKCASGEGATNETRAPLVSCPSSYPMEGVAIDILVALSETANHNKFIMVVGRYLLCDQANKIAHVPSAEFWLSANDLLLDHREAKSTHH